MKLTIHTATYNRAYILGKAYESLCAQTCKDFECIITDDGSTDGTDSLVRSWQEKDNGFPIIYNPLPHVGIPRALNSGVERSSTDWFLMLDSDDKLATTAVESIIKWLAEVEDKADFVGVGFGKCQPNGEYMKKQTPKIDPALGYVDATNVERPLYGLDMDMAEVHRVELLKKFPFQYWETEKYAPEQLNYNAIALAGYKFRWRGDKLYICDYLPDGQTRNDKLVKLNPMGFAMMHNQNMLLRKGFKAKCRCAAQMTALSIYAGHTEYLKKSNCKAATLLTFPYGVALSFRRRKQFKKLK